MASLSARIICGPLWAKLITDDPEVVTLAVTALSAESPGARFTPAYKRKQWDGFTRFLRRPSNIFPAGLRFRLQRSLEVAQVDVRVEDSVDLRAMGSICTPDTVLKNALREPVTWRPHQVTAIETAMARRRIAIQCPTGGGKTLIAADICRRVGGPVLWLVHRKTLLDQTLGVLRDAFQDSPRTHIRGVGGGEKFTNPGHITVAMVQSVASTLSPDLLKAFRTLVIDEAQHASAATWYDIAMKCEGALYRVGLSGTAISKDQVRNLQLEGATGEVVTVATTADLAAEGFLATPTIQFLAVSRESYLSYPDVRQKVCPTWRENPRQLSSLGGKLYATTYLHGITRNRARHGVLLRQVLGHVQAGERVFMLVEKIEHGDNLYTMAMGARALADRTWWINGQDSSAQGDVVRRAAIADFRSLDGGTFLIASGGIFREGVDIPEIDVLFCVGGGESDINTLQAVGRALRVRPDKTTVLIYDVLDGRDPFEPKDYIAAHTLARIRTYRRQQFTLVGVPPNILNALGATEASA